MAAKRNKCNKWHKPVIRLRLSTNRARKGIKKIGTLKHVPTFLIEQFNAFRHIGCNYSSLGATFCIT